jgi:lysozyme
VIPGNDIFDFLRGWESRGGIPDLKAYWDSIGGVWTIGYGHTGPEVVQGLTCTWEMAEEWLRANVWRCSDLANHAIKVPLRQCQYDAFLSILYNVGEGSPARNGIIRLRDGQPSTLLRMINAANEDAAALQFTLWDHSGVKVIEGLHKRRVAEQRVFVWADYSMRP